MLDSLGPAQLLFAAGVLVAAYVVRGITGFGSALVAVPLLALLLPLHAVVPVISLLDYMASLSHGIRHRRDVRWRELVPLLPATLAGVLTALYLFQTVDAEALRRALGVFVVLYAFYALLAPERSGRGSRWWALPGGGFGGLIGTLFGTGGPFYVIYLGLRGLGKHHFRGTIAIIFLIDGGLRLIGYTASGFYDRDTLLLVAAALPVMAAALYAGGHIHTRISPAAFKRAIAVLLVGSGLALVFR